MELRYAPRMDHDIIDELQADWSEERPDLDSEAMGVVLRIQALEKLLGDQVAERLQDFGLQWWQYDVLSALRRQGKPYRMAATELAEASMLTSGAMTNRIDRLEEEGLVRRSHDPADRRRVLVELTRKGRQRVDNATRARFEIAAAAVSGLDRESRRQLSDLLRSLLLAQDADKRQPAP
jgi:DNA-binding MarR family transcriptional regulator